MNWEGAEIGVYDQSISLSSWFNLSGNKVFRFKIQILSYFQEFLVSSVDVCFLIYSIHGTIIRAGITRKKIPCATQLAGGVLLKKLKYFEVIWNSFEFLRVWENLESWMVYANKLFLIAQPYFSTYIIKTS